jgi:hypothetical protein
MRRLVASVGCVHCPPPPLPTGQHPQASSSSCLLLTTPFAVRRLVASVGVLVAFSLTSGTYLSQSEFFFLSISIWSIQSPFSPYQTSSDLQHSRLGALGAMLLPSSSAVAL